eukprot:CAMPEP_0117477850 /NCGR_PEP_ID=MMETSP0784-20121206/11039_1 /TAXON_ID=39447 /ORGANISM="" /LENGTH=331 /DNA_ID=CAMNT_0005272173 /DNA_START=13 /DNA_END=1005 /DNA_ORIENTATION=+
MMKIRYVRDARTAHPTGDPSFAVKQCMPGAVPEDESDPFLMCDEFGPTPSSGAHGDDSDEGFDVAWHPHHGMEILSYMIEGRGRHADSLGNRETFDSPGFQWLSVGSGIEHAEGGGTPLGQRVHGFQIWIRMPIERMEDDPRYGIVNPTEIPVVPLDAGLVRVIAGALGDVVGPAQYAVTVQILDVELEAGAEWVYECPGDMDNAMLYAFMGSSTVNGATALRRQQILRFDTSEARKATEARFHGQDDPGEHLLAWSFRVLFKTEPDEVLPELSERALPTPTSAVGLQGYHQEAQEVKSRVHRDATQVSIRARRTIVSRAFFSSRKLPLDA